MSKCPQCGYIPLRGRPKKLDDRKIIELREKGLSLDKIAKKLGVTKSAIQAAVKRNKNKPESK